MRKKTDLAMAIDLAWAAGFFEADGCLSIIKSANKRMVNPQYHVQIEVESTSPTCLARFQHLFGGSIVERKNRNKPSAKPIFMWRLVSNRACHCLKLMLPYMDFKRKQADIALKLQNSMLPVGSNRPKKGRSFAEVNPSTIAYRYQLYLELHQLKKQKEGVRHLPQRSHQLRLQLEDQRNESFINS